MIDEVSAVAQPRETTWGGGFKLDENAAPIAPNGSARSGGRTSRTATMLVVMITLAIMSHFFRFSNGVIAPVLMLGLGIDVGDVGLS